ncbi:hypothetical protein ACFX11_038641 [Malus domestica]
MMDHVEAQCECYEGKVLDDKAKLYGRWFQLDVLDKDYRHPIRRLFGLDVEGGWVMKAPLLEEVDVSIKVEEGDSMETRAVGQGTSSIPDLNEAVGEQDSGGYRLAVVPFMPRALGRQLQDMLEDGREGLVTEMKQPLRLFGAAIELSLRGEGGNQEMQGIDDETIALTLASGVNGEVTMVGGDSPRSIDSDPFNLALFIFGMGTVPNDSSRGKVSNTYKKRQSKTRRFVPPELGKNVTMRMRSGG